ncbi:hypothetical protein HGRIS_004707 [Hohenbuehelia grisea]|uniref:Protein kinase domain-containing protein n=1 Tax=Hohenbuehelia grisea TaxID=104357 RepID=A0ABR3JCN9_9AGAR
MILLRKIARPFAKTALTRSIHLDLQPRQCLNSRYEIIERLGQGQHSTVWLAHDKTRHSSQVAIKVLKNTTTALQGTDVYELEVLQTIAKLADRLPHQAGSSHVLHLLDHFRVKGEDNDHLCLVTKVLGPHLLSVQRSFEASRMPLSLVRHVTRQILEALAFLHDSCNIVHTDIKQDNIMFDVYGNSSPNFLAANVILGDFDTAMPPRGDHQRLIQPVALRSPEVIAGCEWSVKSDIWNLGCIVMQVPLVAFCV